MGLQIVTPTMGTNLTWLKNHERLILGVLLLCVIVFGVIKYTNYAAHRDELQAAVSAKVLAAQVQANTALLAQAQKDKTDYLTTLATAQKAIQAQQQAILTLQSQLVKQRQVDQTLPLPDLAQRWAMLAGLGSGEITPTPNGVNVTDSGARKTTQALESVPVLTQELAAEKQIVANKDTQIAACQKSLDSQTTLVTGLQTQLKDTTKACQDEIKAVKAVNRKSKIRWFFAGVVTGLGIRSALQGL